MTGRLLQRMTVAAVVLALLAVGCGPTAETVVAGEGVDDTQADRPANGNQAPGGQDDVPPANGDGEQGGQREVVEGDDDFSAQFGALFRGDQSTEVHRAGPVVVSRPAPITDDFRVTARNEGDAVVTSLRIVLEFDTAALTLNPPESASGGSIPVTEVVAQVSADGAPCPAAARSDTRVGALCDLGSLEPQQSRSILVEFVDGAFLAFAGEMAMRTRTSAQIAE